MRHDDGVEEPILELNRDRGSGPATPIQDRVTLFADQAAQLVDVEKPMRVRRREDAAGSAGDCAHSGPALGELATRFDEALDQRLAGLEGSCANSSSVSTARRAIQLAPCSRSFCNSSTPAGRRDIYESCLLAGPVTTTPVRLPPWRRPGERLSRTRLRLSARKQHRRFRSSCPSTTRPRPWPSSTGGRSRHWTASGARTS